MGLEGWGLAESLSLHGASLGFLQAWQPWGGQASYVVAQSSKGKNAETTRPLKGLGPKLSVVSLAAYSTGLRSHKGTQIWGWGVKMGTWSPPVRGRSMRGSVAIISLPPLLPSCPRRKAGDLTEPDSRTPRQDRHRGVWRMRLSGYMAA